MRKVLGCCFIPLAIILIVVLIILIKRNEVEEYEFTLFFQWILRKYSTDSQQFTKFDGIVHKIERCYMLFSCFVFVKITVLNNFSFHILYIVYFCKFIGNIMLSPFYHFFWPFLNSLSLPTPLICLLCDSSVRLTKYLLTFMWRGNLI